MGKTTISWTERTWNPVRGCSRTIAAGAAQSGCGDGTGGGCYAEAMAGRFCGPGMPYEGLVRPTANGPRWTGVVRMVPEHLADPMRWRKPQLVFVNSMSDLFHESLSNEQIAAVFGVMAAAPRHTFQVLTKRAERMRDWFRWALGFGELRSDALMRCRAAARRHGVTIPGHDVHVGGVDWPLANVWIGVSVENQEAADERVPLLLETPAALRFLSCEPLLGPVVVGALGKSSIEVAHPAFDAPDGAEVDGMVRVGTRWERLASIDWVIAGCESGAKARPARLEWYRSLRDQCKAAGTAFHLKQAVSTMDVTLPGLGIEGGAHGHLVDLPTLDGRRYSEIPRPVVGTGVHPWP